MWALIVAADPPKVSPWWAIIAAVFSGLAGAVLGFWIRGAEFRREQRLKAYATYMSELGAILLIYDQLGMAAASRDDDLEDHGADMPEELLDYHDAKAAELRSALGVRLESFGTSSAMVMLIASGEVRKAVDDLGRSLLAQNVPGRRVGSGDRQLKEFARTAKRDIVGWKSFF